MTGVPLFPPQASSVAAKVDALYAALLVLSTFFGLLIAGLLVFLAVRYREGAGRGGGAPHDSLLLELAWTIVPTLIVLGIFYWSARLFLELRRTPPGAMELSVVAKQWMWKVQHPEGRSEINSLHVPAGKPVVLRMISQDVIHSFFVPAFRVKQDVLPGRYTTLWFEATRPGRYHLFCAEYCGTSHALMRGFVEVLEPARYQRWLAGGPPAASPAERGARLYAQLACAQCHEPGGRERAPGLRGVFGRRRALEGGGSVLADEDYVRESILDPRAKVVRGYARVMPAYAGRLDEEGVRDLLAYLKTLSGER